MLIVTSSITIVVTGWSYYQHYRDRDLAITKNWPAQPIFQQGKAVLKTSWRQNRLYYQLYVFPISEEILTRYRASNAPTARAFSLDFEDRAGFKLNTVGIDLNQMTTVVNDEGKAGGLEIKDSIYFERDSYRNSATVSVGWSSAFDTVAQEIEREKTIIPKRAAGTKQTVRQPAGESAFFTVGSSKDEVLQVQGQPTSASTYTWWYGNSYVSFDHNGRVSGWWGGGLKPRMLEGRTVPK